MKLVSVSPAQGRLPITVFQLHDRVNMGNAAELEQAATQAFTAGARNLVIDLTRVPSLTSAGIRTILIIYKMFADPKTNIQHLKLVNPTAHVREVLKIAGLIDLIHIYDNLDEAVASFSVEEPGSQ